MRSSAVGVSAGAVGRRDKMGLANVMQVNLRLGDNGPGYIAKGPWIDVGEVVLRPEKAFSIRYHERI